MTGLDITLKDCCLLICLMLTTTAEAFNPPQTFALSRRDGRLCMMDISGNQSTLVCYHSALFEKAVEGKGLPDSSQFLTRCPGRWVERNNCTIMRIEPVEPLNARERLHKVFYTTYATFLDEVNHFLHNSLDDLLEDAITIALPSVAGYGAYAWWGKSFLTAFLLFEAANSLLSILGVGDSAGDLVESYQNSDYQSEGESEFSIRGIVSNKVEDHAKVVGYIITYNSLIIIQYLENTYRPSPADVTDGVVTQLGTGISLLVIKAGMFTFNTWQMANHYSWMNEISDAIADMVTDMLFGEP
ncbi:hypothetical protein [Endozoicomonas lisbonensis]|uniref:Uncharacterized protein n=1 Tax=Endozoicomonas lisbonensis TaxID=3120522 RepID=A0ABV2SKF8_9GAMM